MSRLNIIRAWKDPEYRASLTDGERAILPENPAGSILIPDSALDSVAGGSLTLDFPFCAPSIPDVCTAMDLCAFTVPAPVCPRPIPAPLQQ
jgi:mersacidin/lichenicidin family type 2 lantibiotic